MDEDPRDADEVEPALGRPSRDRFTIHDYSQAPEGHRRLRRLPHLVWLALVVVWRAARRQFIFASLLQAATAAGLALQLLVLRRLITQLLQNRSDFTSLIPLVVALMTAGAVVALAGILLEVQQRLLGVLVTIYTTDQLIEAATSVELITYESPEFHDRLQRAQLSAQSRPTQLAQGVLGIAGASLAVGGIGVALFLIQPLFFGLVMIGFIPGWLATNRAGRLAYRFSWEQTERERRRGYIFGVLTRKEEAQEVRAFDLGGFLRQRHRRLFDALLADIRVLLRKRLRISLVGQLATAAVGAGTVGLLVWLLTADRISLSAAGSAAGAIVLLSGRLKSLADSVGGLYEGSLYLEDYSSFVAAAKPASAAQSGLRPAPERLDHVRADAVTFTYPSRAEASLIDASLELDRGEVVALVGENGSGKSTFAKLLAGLYHPQSGSVTWDGIDTSTMDPASARSRVAVIFQDFVRFYLSAYDNVAFGDHKRAGDRAAVVRATQEAGIHEEIERLDHGYETLLGPQFYGGSSLSGGQWQRVALARAFFRAAPLVILDEPTASLDARAEASLYASMGELFRGRGVLLISHRFGSVRSADRIYVLHKGRVVEVGTHADLIALDGYYAELYRLQARWYVD